MLVKAGMSMFGHEVYVELDDNLSREESDKQLTEAHAGFMGLLRDSSRLASLKPLMDQFCEKVRESR